MFHIEDSLPYTAYTDMRMGFDEKRVKLIQRLEIWVHIPDEFTKMSLKCLIMVQFSPEKVLQKAEEKIFQNMYSNISYL